MTKLLLTFKIIMVVKYCTRNAEEILMLLTLVFSGEKVRLYDKWVWALVCPVSICPMSWPVLGRGQHSDMPSDISRSHWGLKSSCMGQEEHEVPAALEWPTPNVDATEKASSLGKVCKLLDYVTVSTEVLSRAPFYFLKYHPSLIPPGRRRPVVLHPGRRVRHCGPLGTIRRDGLVVFTGRGRAAQAGDMSTLGSWPQRSVTLNGNQLCNFVFY